jgi:hypothetical protein
VTLGLDHAGRPADYAAWAKAAYDAGYRFDCRYLCRTGARAINDAKIARPAEVAAARAAGLDIVLIWEDGKRDSDGGHEAGLANGAEAKRQAIALGAPTDTWLYFAAADYDAPATDHTRIGEYLRGCAEGAAPYRIAGYGKNTVGRAMLDAGVVAGWWQSYGFSRPEHVVETWANIYQGRRIDGVGQRAGATVGGIACDVDEIIRTPTGAWPAKEAPVSEVDIQAKHYQPMPGGRQIDLLVVHSMEMDEKPDTAEGCGHYFATTAVVASAHECADNNSRVTCVRDMDIAYAAPGANHNGLHVEQAGFARQSRAEWLDAFSRPMIEEQVALWVAEKAALYHIPLDFLDPAALKTLRPRGVTTHNNVRLAYGQTTHTDPGTGYPMDVMLAAAHDHYPGAVPTPLPPLEETIVSMTVVPSWAKRDPKTSRTPWFRVVPLPPKAGQGFAADVLALNGAHLTRLDETSFGVVGVTHLTRMAAPAIGIDEIESTGAIVVLGEDGGQIDVAARPAT